MSNIACAQADILSLGLIIWELPKGSIWSVGGVGDPQLKMNAMALKEYKVEEQKGINTAIPEIKWGNKCCV